METPRPRSRYQRWLKRLGWTFIILITVLVVATVIENWTGREAWNAAVAEVTASGDSLDPDVLIPPPVPDAENFALSPLFQNTGETKSPLSESFKPGSTPFKPSIKPSWTGGRQVDLTAWQKHYRKMADTMLLPPPPGKKPADRKDVTPFWRAHFEKEPDYWKSPDHSAAEDVLAALRAFDPEHEALNKAALLPRSRFPIRYEDNFAMSPPHYRPLQDLATLTALRSVAELAAHQVDASFEDLLLTLRLADAIEHEPILVAMLVRGAILDEAMQPLWEGLVRHQWTNPQLVRMEEALSEINLVAHYQLSIRGERTLNCVALMDQLQANPALTINYIAADKTYITINRAEPTIGHRLIPKGWFDHNKASAVRSFQKLLGCVDANAMRFFPSQTAKTTDNLEADLDLSFKLHSILARFCLPVLTPFPIRCARQQDTIHLARIAIALERHRLLHHDYPESLEALAPSVRLSGQGIPWDVATGHPPRYRRVSEIQFTLYYDGWNGTDDGGEVVLKDRSPDLTKGDWVWPSPQESKAQSR